MLVKVLTPGFYARKDVKTPVRIAIGVLIASVAANFLLIPVMGIYSLALVTSAGRLAQFAPALRDPGGARPFPHARLAGRRGSRGS